MMRTFTTHFRQKGQATYHRPCNVRVECQWLKGAIISITNIIMMRFFTRERYAVV